MSNERYIDDERYIDLPPVKGSNLEKGAAENDQEVIKQQGTERNPELLSTQTGGQTNTQQSPQPPAKDQAASKHQASPQGSQAATLTMPQIADDTDLIEKEWVEKAQDIIRRTKGNPHVQSKELGQVKAEYLKRRFDRQVGSASNTEEIVP